MTAVEPTSDLTQSQSIPFYQSLFVKITALVGMTALVVALVVAYLNGAAGREMAVSSVSSSAQQLSLFLADGLAGAVRFKDTEQLSHTSTEVIETSGQKINAVAILNAEGETLGSSGPVSDEFVSLGVQSISEAAMARSGDGLTVSAPIMDKKGNVVGAIVVGGDISAALGAFNQRLSQSLWISALVLVAALCASSFLLFRLFTKPLREAETAMAAIAVKNFDIELDKSKRKDEIGSILRRVHHFRDELHEADKNSRMTLFQSSAFRGSSVPMVMVSENNNVVGENKAWEKLLSLRSDAFAKLWPNLAGTSLQGQSMEPLRAHLGELAEALNVAERLPFKTDISLGDHKISVAASAILDESGKFSGSILEWQDVTERRLNSGLLEAIRQDNGIVEIDLEGKIREVNDLVLDFYGMDRDALLGRPYLELPGSSQDQMQDIWDHVLAGESVQKKVKRSSFDGRDVWVDIFVNPVLDYKGDIYRIIEISNDVTKQELETERLYETRKTEEANQRQVVGELRQALSALANGRLRHELSEPFSEDYEQLRQDFNRATQQLCAAISEISEVADNITAGAREISQGSDDLSQRTENQAATLEETAAALEEITASVKASADGASDANNAVLGARDNAQDGGQIVLEAVSAMNEIESSANQISQIIGVIDDIAFQTNLLALNAGVEAARAGEAGRGFAVVASEVRALAQRSSEAAKEIKGLISASSQHVEKGVGLVGKTGDALNRIVESVENISELVGAITASSKEQSIGLGEINEGVTQLDSVTQQNAAMVEESTAASHAMRIEAEKLEELINAFDVGSRERGAQVKAAGDHARVPEVARQNLAASQPTDNVASNSWQDF